MDARTRILEAAAELFAASPDADVSTRAVCDAAGVGPQTLYRHFGDKEGLLAAVVDHGYENYLASKRAVEVTDDPVADLRRGWDNNVAFGLAQPNYYRLMWAPGVAVAPRGAAEAHRMLEHVLERCAEAGELLLPPRTAAMMVMSANVGVVLSLICRPELFPDPTVATRVRDAVFDAVLRDAVLRNADRREPPAAVTATTLAAQAKRNPPEALTATETALMLDWLARIAEATPPG